MNRNGYLLFFIFILILLSCSKDEGKKSVIKEKSLDLQVLQAYQEAIKYLEEGDALYAASKFNEAELLFPQSDWAPKSALMAAYSYYFIDNYEDAINEIELWE